MKPMSRNSNFFIALILILIGAESGAEIDWAFEDSMEAIVDDINEGSGQAFSDAVDIDALLDKVFKDVDIGEKTKAGFSIGFTTSRNQLGKKTVQKVGKEYYAILLNVRYQDDRAFALIRYDIADLRFAYNEYELVKDDSGTVRIVDWLDYLDGYQYSAALRLSVIAHDATAASVRSLVPEYHGSDEEYAKFAEVISAYGEKDYQTFYSGSATLSRELRQTRFMHLLTCRVSLMTRDKNLTNQAYRELSKHFGDDPTIAMTLIPYYFNKGDNDKAMKSLRLLQDGLGVRDGGLLVFMSRAALGFRNPEEASILADEAVSAEPTLEAAYWAAINAHVRMNHHSFAVMTARSLEDQFEKSIEQERFEDSPAYVEFVKSSHYIQWQKDKRP